MSKAPSTKQNFGSYDPHKSPPDLDLAETHFVSLI